MNEAMKQRIQARIAERERLGMTAEQFDKHVLDSAAAAHREMQARVKVSVAAAVCGDVSTSLRWLDEAKKASAERRQHVEYAKRFGVIVSK